MIKKYSRICILFTIFLFTFVVTACSNNTSKEVHESESSSSSKKISNRESGRPKSYNEQSTTHYKNSANDSEVASYNGISLSNRALACILYSKYYPDSTDLMSDHSMYLSVDKQGRQEVGFGTGDSDLFYKVNGNEVTVWKIQDDPNKPSSDQDYDQTSESIKDLIEEYYTIDAQQRTINSYANKLIINNN